MRTPEEEEFLTYTADIYEMWSQLLVQRGIVQGFKQGISQGISQGLEEGRGKGLEEGRERGLKEGREEGRAEILERNRKLLLLLLRQRFGDDVDGATEQRLEAASAAQIEAWLERVVSASTLAELLAPCATRALTGEIRWATALAGGRAVRAARAPRRCR